MTARFRSFHCWTGLFTLWISFFGGDIRAFVNCFATLKIFFNLACHIFASTIQLAYIFNLVIIVFNVFGIILIDLL